MYPETRPAKWLFPQEKATQKTLCKDTFTLVPLEAGCNRDTGVPWYPDCFSWPENRFPYSQCPISDRLAVPGVSEIELLVLT
jgi:hypothetical protein